MGREPDETNQNDGIEPSLRRPTLVVFHAHPDDEAIFTGGTILRAVVNGWRAVLVVATNGEEGWLPDGSTQLDLGNCRRSETARAAALLGIGRVHFLDYRDSGVAGDRANDDPRCLAAADLHGAAGRLRQILLAEGATALTTYDANGIYGHPDHVRVHHIGALAAVGTSCEVYESTVSRRALVRLRTSLLTRGLQPDVWPEALVGQLGVASHGEDELVGVDVSAAMGTKLAAMAAHGSQIAGAGTFMGVPAGAFHQLIGTEWFRPARVGAGLFLDQVLAEESPSGHARAALLSNV